MRAMRRLDLVLALDGPLSLCCDPYKTAGELRRATRAGGYVICDAGSREGRSC